MNNNNYLNNISTEFEENEFLDYINFKGFWKTSVIPNREREQILKITDIVNQEFFSMVQQGRKNSIYANYGRNKNYEYEPRDEDIENLTIPIKNVNNYLLGEIIEIITDLKNNIKNTQENFNNYKPMIDFSYIPIKVSVLGHCFSGKKTQAKMLSESNTNLKVYSIEDLIKKSIETLEKLETPIENNPKFKSLKKNQIDNKKSNVSSN
jgi:hypothetical protein